MSSSKKGGNGGAMVGAAATIAAMSAAAYLLFGPEGKKHRKAVRGWAVKMKGEMIEDFEKVQDLSEPVYHAIVDKVQAKYAKIKGIDQAELASAISDIKKHWKAMSKTAKPKAKKAIKKTVAKVKKEMKKASKPKAQK